MLKIKFQGHQSIGSGGDFFKVLPCMGMAAILVIWLWLFEQFSFLKTLDAVYEIWLQLAL